MLRERRPLRRGAVQAPQHPGASHGRSVRNAGYVTFTPSKRVAFVYRDEELFDALDVLTITDLQHGGRKPKAGAQGRALRRPR